VRAYFKKNRPNLGEQKRGRKVSVEDRGTVLRLVKETLADGAVQGAVCEMLGVTQKTVQRWRYGNAPQDGRRGPNTQPGNKRACEEQAKIISLATSREFVDKSPHQIVPTLADRGEYVASESSFYRVMRAHELLAHRGRAKA